MDARGPGYVRSHRAECRRIAKHGNSEAHTANARSAHCGLVGEKQCPVGGKARAIGPRARGALGHGRCHGWLVLGEPGREASSRILSCRRLLLSRGHGRAELNTTLCPTSADSSEEPSGRAAAVASCSMSTRLDSTESARSRHPSRRAIVAISPTCGASASRPSVPTTAALAGSIRCDRKCRPRGASTRAKLKAIRKPPGSMSPQWKSGHVGGVAETSRS